MEPNHAALMHETRLLEQSAAMRAELAAARARFQETREQMHEALVQAQWPRDVLGPHDVE